MNTMITLMRGSLRLLGFWDATAPATTEDPPRQTQVWANASELLADQFTSNAA